MFEFDNTLTVATNEALANPENRIRLQWRVFREGIAQRDWPTVIQDDMREADELGVRLQHAPVRFEIPLVDDVFPHERYVRDFVNGAGACLAADRLIALHFQIRRHLAVHFRR